MTEEASEAGHRSVPAAEEDTAGATRGGPLAGLRVIEMAGIGPAPLAGQFLADLGAQVTVIDRRSGRTDPANISMRGKRSVALNLKHAAGVTAALSLIAEADVLIEGFRPGVMERMGLGPEPCAAANPRLIYARMTGWGQDGPLAREAGHDITYLALTGVLGAIGPADGPPIPPLNIAADYAGGTMFLLLGILSALFERQGSGRGQVVDAAMVDGVPALMALMHGLRAQGIWQDGREANLLDGGAPFYRCYQTADGKAIAVGALEPQFYAEFLARAGLPREHLASQMDRATWPARREEYAAHFATRSRDEWAAVFAGSDACVAPVLDWEETRTHPHMAARSVYATRDGVAQAQPAPRFGRTPPPAPGPVAAPRGATEATLRAAGYSPEAIAELRAQGVLT
ncbi:MAG: CaiB/BaiF CoA-transferase family protein [Pseudomonadota bacterium]